MRAGDTSVGRQADSLGNAAATESMEILFLTGFHGWAGIQIYSHPFRDAGYHQDLLWPVAGIIYLRWVLADSDGGMLWSMMRWSPTALIKGLITGWNNDRDWIRYLWAHRDIRKRSR